MKHAIFFGALAVVAVGLVPQATARGHATTEVKAAKAFVRPDPAAMRWTLAQIARHRNETWRWQRVMQLPRTRYAASAHTARSLPYRKWVMQLWFERALKAKRRAHRPPHLKEFLCIHGYEGSWTDPNSPYYGGLQMDIEFQQTYGPHLYRQKGTADNWTPLEQIWVAERAYKTRGFWPWPNTARYCGLI